ncbi:RNAse H domain protein, YqgF family [Amylolactobacillus amylotrophicus DSM 20534]|uniref:Holliday junction DNA helicase RuvA n=3 Tax=Amylolactobacillus TaxID=2767876 RepID=A0A1L6XAT4_9LACO|nr:MULTISPECIES: Holliday junction resolvase RuvX [Amylolactobacillus]APT18063.1 Holliday junction DNA helicase RuvA [Amylolactobacillus amylophilus DSM 20533 = JCM 1125]KRK37408.1 RNAse H domain protein, YqgF family [Amylolactobacillus amylotrophicus DSM 20534]KRM42081.1 RNAse H domain protein, YqgF family [Amylolactobacillus amylophilus DSM 20533 = JCM 1125]GED80578.1 putative pre-16S rRNA nuclease [Amylolactobacillus amylophilus]
MRLLGLDVGSKTVGVAVSDQLGIIAQGVEIIPIDEETENFGMRRMKKLVREYEVDGFVVGLPKNMNNTVGERALKAESYGKRLATKFGLPVFYNDERLTTVQAERMLIEEGNVRREDRELVIDKLAATLILQNYLDQQRNGVN